MSRQKGNRNIRKVIERYKEELSRDWKIDRVERTAKWIKEKDMFGLFDLVAVAPKGHVHLIQVKTNRPPTQQPFRDFASKYASHKVKVKCFTWYDYKGWRIQTYLKNGKIKEVDER